MASSKWWLVYALTVGPGQQGMAGWYSSLRRPHVLCSQGRRAPRLYRSRGHGENSRSSAAHVQKEHLSTVEGL